MNHNKHYWQCKVFTQIAINAKCLNPECLQDAWDRAHIIASFINDKNKEQHEQQNPFKQKNSYYPPLAADALAASNAKLGLDKD